MATCKIGDLRNHTMRYITTPHFVQNFRADMNSIGATWGNVSGKGSWIFKPEHMAQVKAWAAFYFPEPVVAPVAQVEPVRTPAEAFAVAMGLGIIAEDDLS